MRLFIYIFVLSCSLSLKAASPVRLQGAQYNPLRLSVTSYHDFGDAGSITLNTGISSIMDKSGNGHTLSAAAAGNRPAFDTVNLVNGFPNALFDGTANCLTYGITLAQPISVVLVCQEVTWGDVKAIFDGVSSLTMAFRQRAITPNIRYTCDGAKHIDSTQAAIGSWVVFIVTANGANSSIQVNNLAPVTGDAGIAANIGGFSLGAQNGVNASNIRVLRSLLVGRVLTANEVSYVLSGESRNAGICLY